MIQDQDAQFQAAAEVMWVAQVAQQPLIDQEQTTLHQGYIKEVQVQVQLRAHAVVL